jgi:hypothetical protein
MLFTSDPALGLFIGTLTEQPVSVAIIYAHGLLPGFSTLTLADLYAKDVTTGTG